MLQIFILIQWHPLWPSGIYQTPTRTYLTDKWNFTATSFKGTASETRT